MQQNAINAAHAVSGELSRAVIPFRKDGALFAYESGACIAHDNNRQTIAQVLVAFMQH